MYTESRILTDYIVNNINYRTFNVELVFCIFKNKKILIISMGERMGRVLVIDPLTPPIDKEELKKKNCPAYCCVPVEHGTIRVRKNLIETYIINCCFIINSSCVAESISYELPNPGRFVQLSGSEQ